MVRTSRVLFAVVAIVLTTSMCAWSSAYAHGSTVGEGLRLAGANPFRGQTAFAFKINHDMRNLDLSIFNVSGQRVAQVFHGDLAAGDHRYAFAPHGLPTGMYLVRLKTEHGVYVKHLTLLQ